MLAYSIECIAKNEKRKDMAHNLKYKYIVLSIEHHISYLAYYIAK